MFKFTMIYNPWYLLYVVLVSSLYALTYTNFLPGFFVHLPLILAFIPVSYENEKYS